MGERIIVTVGRQFGSGGREIAKVLAERLGVAFYDKELLTLAAKQSGLNEDVIRQIDERATDSLLYSLSMGAAPFGSVSLARNMPINDQLFLTQTQIIKDIAAHGSAVIVGRCADYVLRDNPSCVSVFIHASLPARIMRVKRLYEMSTNQAKQHILKTDKKRADYYNFYSGNKWGQVENYDLTFDSSKLGVQESAKVIEAYVTSLAPQNIRGIDIE